MHLFRTNEPSKLPKPLKKRTTIKVQTNFAKGKEKYASVDLRAPFATAIIDPDWPYTIAPGRETITDEEKGRLWGFTRNRQESQNQYKQHEPLSIEQLKALPIKDIVGGYIHLWTVAPFLLNGAATAILEAWDFKPVSMMTWAKYDPCQNRGFGGVGYWYLGNAEFCITAKSKGFPSIRTGVSSLIIARKGQHSVKPEHLHELCENRFPGPFLEIFGRASRPGWVVLGDESPDGQDIRHSLKKYLWSKKNV